MTAPPAQPFRWRAGVRPWKMFSRVHSFAYLFERLPSFVQTFCYREAEEMVRQGMSPFIASIRQPSDPPELAEPLRAPIFYLPEEKPLRAEVDRRREAGELPRAVRRAMSRHRGEADSQRLFEAVWLAPELKRRGIRHVHAHFGGMAARTAWWLRRLFGIRYSFTGHANDIFCENDFPVTNAMLVQAAEFVVTETDFARRWMEQRHPFAKGRVFRVFNGIDLSGFLPRARPGAVPRLLSVGRYVEKKGFPDLIEACRLLRERGRKFECQIVGGGPLEEELCAQIEAAGLAREVQLPGPRSQREVRELLATADVFVLPCVPEAGGGSDNLPTVIMEAMAAGVPCICTPIAGVPEMITSGADGLLVPPRDPPAVAAAIERLLDSPELAARLGAAGRATAREKFAIEKTTGDLKRLLVRRARVPVPAEALAREPALREPALLKWWRRIAALLLLFPNIALAADPRGDSPETPPQTPEQQLAKFHLPPGFEIQLVAAEPEIQKPINLNFDAAGRLWVTGSELYPWPAATDAAGRADPRLRANLRRNRQRLRRRRQSPARASRGPRLRPHPLRFRPRWTRPQNRSFRRRTQHSERRPAPAARARRKRRHRHRLFHSLTSGAWKTVTATAAPRTASRSTAPSATSIRTAAPPATSIGSTAGSTAPTAFATTPR